MSSRYPTEEELKRITDWPFDDLAGLMDFIEQIIDYYGAVRKIDGRYHVITGGWSGNEDVVGALLNNTWVFASCYQSWERGGKFVFAKDIENTEVDDMLERITALEAERDAARLAAAAWKRAAVWRRAMKEIEILFGGNWNEARYQRLDEIIGKIGARYE